MTGGMEKVFIVDDDREVRESLEALLGSIELPTECHHSAAAFLEAFDHSGPGCIVMDVRMPGMSGLDLQRALKERDVRLPVVIMTGHADVDVAVRSFRMGAFDFLEKPFSDSAMVDIVQRAVAHSRTLIADRAEDARVAALLSSLTPRERELVPLLIEGASNKDIGRRLGISHRTAERHRQNIMDKLSVHSSVGLANLLARR